MSPGTKSAWVCVVTGPVGGKKKQEMLKYEKIFFCNTSECCSSNTLKSHCCLLKACDTLVNSFLGNQMNFFDIHQAHLDVRNWVNSR